MSILCLFGYLIRVLFVVHVFVVIARRPLHGGLYFSSYKVVLLPSARLMFVQLRVLVVCDRFSAACYALHESFGETVDSLAILLWT